MVFVPDFAVIYGVRQYQRHNYVILTFLKHSRWGGTGGGIYPFPKFRAVVIFGQAEVNRSSDWCCIALYYNYKIFSARRGARALYQRSLLLTYLLTYLLTSVENTTRMCHAHSTLFHTNSVRFSPLVSHFRVVHGQRFWYQSKGHNLCDFLVVNNSNFGRNLHRF